MIHPKHLEELEDVTEKLKTALPLGDFVQKLKKSSPEERAKVSEIAKGVGKYLRNKDYDGAKKFLTHVRTQI